MEDIIRWIRICCEVLSVSTVLATLVGYLPSAAAVLSIIWLLICFYDRFWGKGKR